MQKNGFQIEENRSQGFIKLYRSFTKWEWYDDANTMRVFLHCLIMANHEVARWRGNIIERGSFITSYSKLASELNLTSKKIRLALKRLAKTEELSIESNNHFSIIKVLKYEEYQEKGAPKSSPDNEEEQNNGEQGADDGQSNGNRTTTDGQSEGEQGATNKNEKNNKNDKNEKKRFNAKSSFQELLDNDEKINEFSSYKDLFFKWLDYKTAIKKQYKTEQGVRNAFINLVNLSQKNLENAIDIIEYAISKEWQNFFAIPEKDKKILQQQKANKQNQSSSRNDYWESGCM